MFSLVRSRQVSGPPPAPRGDVVLLEFVDVKKTPGAGGRGPPRWAVGVTEITVLDDDGGALPSSHATQLAGLDDGELEAALRALAPDEFLSLSLAAAGFPDFPCVADAPAWAWTPAAPPLSCLAAWGRVTTLSLSWRGRLDLAGAPLGGVRRLSLAGDPESPDGVASRLAGVCELPALESLRLTSVSLAAGLPPARLLGAAPGLTSLELDASPLWVSPEHGEGDEPWDEAASAALARLTRLTRLTLTRDFLTADLPDEPGVDLRRAPASLRELHVQDREDGEYEVCLQEDLGLPRLTALESLTVARTALAPATPAALEALGRVRRLALVDLRPESRLRLRAAADLPRAESVVLTGAAAALHVDTEGLGPGVRVVCDGGVLENL